MIDRFIAEATECDFKVALERKKPKSWLKTVSAFSNGIGGTIFFGVDDDKNIVGLTDAQADAETISHLIKERITPYPDFILSPEKINEKDILKLTIFAGHSTPYYYKADGITEAYIRIGNESIFAPNYVLNQLILKGINRTYDALPSEYNFNDYAFTKLRERYKAWTGNSLEEKMFESFDICDINGKLTNAGALLADNSPIKHSRLFCTRWNGLDKSGGIVDALDSAEYSGSLIILLNEGLGFVKRNMKKRWMKTDSSRIEMPDFCERSVFEAIVNALIHRDYLILGSEVHIDIYDDRLTIYSPGGMADGSRIQERDIYNVSSTRRNPVLADIFARLGYMERQGSGFKKIAESYRSAHNYTDDLAPEFFSDVSSFQVTLYNLNYPDNNQSFETEKAVVSDEKQSFETEKAVVSDEKQSFETEKAVVSDEKQLFEAQLLNIKTKAATKETIVKLYRDFGFDKAFSRADIMSISGITSSPAGALINKLKKADFITPVTGQGKGKYKFKRP